MKRLAILALVLAGCGGALYTHNDLELVTAYTAKETCSCVFVMQQTDEYCGAWTAADPAVAGVRIDREKKTVESFAAVFWGAKAKWVGAREGCVIE